MSNKEFVLKTYPDAKCEKRRSFAVMGWSDYYNLSFGDYEVNSKLESTCWKLAKEHIENERTT